MGKNHATSDLEPRAASVGRKDDRGRSAREREQGPRDTPEMSLRTASDRRTKRAESEGREKHSSTYERDAGVPDSSMLYRVSETTVGREARVHVIFVIKEKTK
jgi:hypothetical protein